MITDTPKSPMEKYEAEVCEHCKQTTTYLIPIDRGTSDIMKAISVAIGRKGINCIHPRKEMEIGRYELDYETMIKEGQLTSNQVGNLSRPRFHGLIAAVDGNPGNYCLTTKGATFLHHGSVPKYAIISKVTGHQIGYWKPDKYRCTIDDFKPDMEYWQGITWTVMDGKIVHETPDIIRQRNRMEMVGSPQMKLM